eukprot:jgi/Bigna1/78827/fgenesh1_pg.57_\
MGKCVLGLKKSGKTPGPPAKNQRWMSTPGLHWWKLWRWHWGRRELQSFAAREKGCTALMLASHGSETDAANCCVHCANALLELKANIEAKNKRGMNSHRSSDGEMRTLIKHEHTRRWLDGPKCQTETQRTCTF